jgi:hypothetical protein
MRQIANFVTKTERELTVLCELFRIWIFVNAVDVGIARFFSSRATASFAASMNSSIN